MTVGRVVGRRFFWGGSPQLIVPARHSARRQRPSPVGPADEIEEIVEHGIGGAARRRDERSRFPRGSPAHPSASLPLPARRETTASRANVRSRARRLRDETESRTPSCRSETPAARTWPCSRDAWHRAVTHKNRNATGIRAAARRRCRARGRCGLRRSSARRTNRSPVGGAALTGAPSTCASSCAPRQMPSTGLPCSSARSIARSSVFKCGRRC